MIMHNIDPKLSCLLRNKDSMTRQLLMRGNVKIKIVSLKYIRDNLFRTVLIYLHGSLVILAISSTAIKKGLLYSILSSHISIGYHLFSGKFHIRRYIRSFRLIDAKKLYREYKMYLNYKDIRGKKHIIVRNSYFSTPSNDILYLSEFFMPKLSDFL